jgi:hypothetical protein
MTIAAGRLALRRSASGIGLIASVAVISTSCDNPTGPRDVASVRVTPQKWTFTSLGDTVRFTAQARDASGRAVAGQSFTWSAEPSGIVLIRDDGVATAIGPGVARVSASTKAVLPSDSRASTSTATIAGSVNVAVTQIVVSVVSVTSAVRLTALGDSTPFGLEARDAQSFEVKGTTFSYRSSNESVVSVSPTGSMKALSPGFAYVVGTAFGKSDSVTVDVRQDVVTVVISPDTAMIQDGSSRQFSALLKDRNGYPVTGRSIDWTTSDARVVTVNGTGLATPKATRLGPATITATTEGAIGQAPVYVFTPFAAVSAFGEQTCALSSLGRPYCWGLLNYSTGQRSEVPLAVSGTPRLRSIGAGADLSCGLATDGTAYCWAKSSMPSATAVANPTGFMSQSVGQPEVYALTSGGAAYAWSDGTPPTAVAGGLSFATISASGGYACATVATGAAYCWGSNAVGELGDSTYQDRAAPTAVHGGLAFATISAGGGHTCGITTGGAAYCWGHNNYGAFGDGTITNSPIPVPAAGNLALTSVKTGGWHTCGLDASGAAYCWGFNDHGGVGDGSFVHQRLVPVPVAGGLRFTSLSLGGEQSCGLTANGSLYCWGRNYDRELGDGTSVNRAVPTLVAGSPP